MYISSLRNSDLLDRQRSPWQPVFSRCLHSGPLTQQLTGYVRNVCVCARACVRVSAFNVTLSWHDINSTWKL